MPDKVKPNPGSAEAVEQGCTCPVIDNCYGEGIPMGKDGSPLFWHSENCPLHGRSALNTPPVGMGKMGGET